MRNICLLVVFVSSLMTSVQIQAQVSKVNSEDIMDAAFDMKKASERADKLASDMSKYCKWDAASFDTSDLDVAISRFLLDHGSHVPETVLASKLRETSTEKQSHFTAFPVAPGIVRVQNVCNWCR
jgi:hypothetical protein